MPQLLAHLFGDYILQSDWMAQNKTKASLPAFCHALLYSAAFWMLAVHAHHPWACWLTIFVTHFLIDRFRLARYVVWAKNFIAPPGAEHFPMSTGADGAALPTAKETKRRIWHENWKPWRMVDRATGYSVGMPPFLSVWLLIVADNTLHLAINYLALRCL